MKIFALVAALFACTASVALATPTTFCNRGTDTCTVYGPNGDLATVYRNRYTNVATTSGLAGGTSTSFGNPSLGATITYGASGETRTGTASARP